MRVHDLPQVSEILVRSHLPRTFSPSLPLASAVYLSSPNSHYPCLSLLIFFAKVWILSIAQPLYISACFENILNCHGLPCNPALSPLIFNLRSSLIRRLTYVGVLIDRAHSKRIIDCGLCVCQVANEIIQGFSTIARFRRSRRWPQWQAVLSRQVSRYMFTWRVISAGCTDKPGTPWSQGLLQVW